MPRCLSSLLAGTGTVVIRRALRAYRYVVVVRQSPLSAQLYAMFLCLCLFLLPRLSIWPCLSPLYPPSAYTLPALRNVSLGRHCSEAASLALRIALPLPRFPLRCVISSMLLSVTLSPLLRLTFRTLPVVFLYLYLCFDAKLLPTALGWRRSVPPDAHLVPAPCAPAPQPNLTSALLILRTRSGEGAHNSCLLAFFSPSHPPHNAGRRQFPASGHSQLRRRRARGHPDPDVEAPTSAAHCW